MKAEELRIGNLVELICDGHEDEPDLLEWGIEDYDFYIKRMNDVKPIPLTEEWLLKLGFEKDENVNYRYYLSYDGLVIIAYDLDDKCIRISETWEFGKRQFVHQFQNLYFALTGEELKIKTQ